MSATVLSLRRSFVGSQHPSRYTFASIYNLPLQRLQSTDAASQTSPQEQQARPKSKWGRTADPRTHFLSLPLYQNAEVWSKMEEFRERLLKSDPPISGLEPDIVFPRINHALEIKLCNVNIKGYELNKRSGGQQQELPAPTVELEQVQEVLQGLKGPLQDILTADGGDGVLRLPLGQVRPLLHGAWEVFNWERVNVLFLEPKAGKPMETLQTVATVVREALTKASIPVGRPTALAMTLINTRNRAVRPRGQRQPFSLASLYGSEAFKAFQPPNAVTLPENARERRVVDLGVGVVSGLYLTRVGGTSEEMREPTYDGKLDFRMA